MFVAGGTLYVVDRTTGQLRSVGWDGASLDRLGDRDQRPGRGQRQDWRARSTFLYAD